MNFISAESQCTHWLNGKLKVCSSDSYYSWSKEALPYLWCFPRMRGILIPIIPLCQLPCCYPFCPSSWAYLGKIAHYNVWFLLFRGTAVACQHKGIARLLPIWRSREWREEIVLTRPADDRPGPCWEPTVKKGSLWMTAAWATPPAYDVTVAGFLAFLQI